MKEKDGKLTSARIPEDLLNDFKVLAVKNKIGIQKLLHRSMYLYSTNIEFRELINEQLSTEYSGSL